MEPDHHSNAPDSVHPKAQSPPTMATMDGRTKEGEGATLESRNNGSTIQGGKSVHVSSKRHEHFPENSPISEEEMLSAARTLQRLWNGNRNFSLYDSPTFRPLRKAIGPFARKMSREMFGGKGRSEYEEKKLLERERRARIAQQKAFDKAQINKSIMRKRRLDKLADLTKRQDPALPLVPDGFVVEPPTVGSKFVGSLLLDSQNNDCKDDMESTDSYRKVQNPRACYICKARFNELHPFYDQLCPSCAKLNFLKRNNKCNLVGRVALVTGGRVKIGFCVALKLLRWGATVIVTTRFPCDCARRYAKEQDFNSWKSRLHVYGIDFRDMRRVEMFCDHLLVTQDRLDILINNACQTIRRPAAYYQPLLSQEATTIHAIENVVSEVDGLNGSLDTANCLKGVLENNFAFLSEMHNQQDQLIGDDQSSITRTKNIRNLDRSSMADASEALCQSSSASGVATSAEQSQMILLPEDALTALELTDSSGTSTLPENATDVNGQQLDLRKRNTWIMKMEEIQTPELAEVFAINAIAPFVLNSRLAPLMRRSIGKGGKESTRVPKFIVNVSAMEGKFYRVKSAYHPHTNMAKAALNMMTRTSAEDLSKSGIFMTAVDTGWINDENPVEKAARYAETHNFQTPLDEVDAAARILDPVVVGLNEGKLLFGVFLKDYFETEW